MLQTDTSPVPRRAARALGWVGMWLCTASLFPLLGVWTQFFNTRRPLRLPFPGTSAFWPSLGAGVLMASLLTFSVWQDSKKPAPRKPTVAPTPTTPRDRWRPALAGVVLLGFIILRGLAVSPGASVDWAGVLGGAAALAGLAALVARCVALALPPRPVREADAQDVARAPTPPTLPLGVRPPRNKCRAEVSAREAVYHRPLSSRIAVAAMGLFFVGMSVAAVWATLLSLGLISTPGIQMHWNPALALMMGGGTVFLVLGALSVLAMAGPRELRVSPSDRTYTYRLSAPMRWSLLANITGNSSGSRKMFQDEMGLPWRTVECSGSVEDIAGIKRLETTHKSRTTYSLFLCWHDLSRPAMRVGFAAKEDEARALQAQAAADLGVSLLPDEVT